MSDLHVPGFDPKYRWIIRAKDQPTMIYNPWARNKSERFSTFNTRFNDEERANFHYQCISSQRLIDPKIPECEIVRVRIEIVDVQVTEPSIQKNHILAVKSRAALVKAYGGVGKASNAIDALKALLLFRYDGNYRFAFHVNDWRAADEIKGILGDRCLECQRAFLVKNAADLMELRLLLPEEYYPQHIIDLDEV